MPTVKVSCVGQTFALARCSDSRERKPRSRKTKEERKVMVESFIKKYQSSNNGSFPSLNLTHKEVGGSFYTIREIVREIIQENKVLGPGSSTSKVLKLEACSEDDVVGSFSMDLPSDLTTSTIGHAIDQRQKELLKEKQMSGKQSFDILESKAQENAVIVSESMDNECSDHAGKNLLNGALANGSLVDSEEDTGRPLSHTHDGLGVNEKLYHDIQNDVCDDFEHLNVERLMHSPQSVSVTSAALAVDDKRSYDMAGAASSSLEKTVHKIMEKDSLPETKNTKSSAIIDISDKLFDHSVPYTIEVFPIPSGKISDPNKNLVSAEGSTNHMGVLKADCLGDELEAISEPADKDLIINEVKSSEKCSFINKDTVTITTSPASQSFEPSASVPRMPELNLCNKSLYLQPVLHPHTSNSVGIDSANSCGEPLPSEFAEAPHYQLKPGHEHLGSNTGNSSSKTRENANPDSDLSEINPFLAAFKAFVAAVIRFWTE